MSQDKTPFWKKLLMVSIVLMILLLVVTSSPVPTSAAADQFSTYLGSLSFYGHKLPEPEKMLPAKRTKTPPTPPTPPSPPSPPTTPTMAPTSSPTNSPTVTATISPTPTATFSPTPAVSVTPSPVTAAKNSSTSNKSPCIIINNSGCSPLPPSPPTYTFSPGSSLEITGNYWGKNIHLDLYLVSSTDTFISSLATLALLTVPQGGCPPLKVLQRNPLAHSTTQTNEQGTFSTQLSIPTTSPSGSYIVCAVSKANRSIIASRRESSILLFDVTIQETPPKTQAESQEPANWIDEAASFNLFSSSLSLLSLLFAFAALAIYFFAPRRSLQPVLATVAVPPRPVSSERMGESMGEPLSGSNHQLVEEATIPLPHASASELPQGLNEVNIQETCAALTQGDVEPVLALALSAQQEQTTLWDSLMEAIEQLPLTVEPPILKALLPDISIRLKRQQPSLRDAVKFLVLSQWLLSGTTEQREVAEIMTSMGDAYLLLKDENQKNIVRAIHCYMVALNILTELGDGEGQARLHMRLGDAYSYIMEDRWTHLHQANNMYLSALAYFEATGQVQRSNALRKYIEQIQAILAGQ